MSAEQVSTGREPGQVPVTLVTTDDGLLEFGADLRGAVRVAIDTETVYRPGDRGGPGGLRVISAAVRRPDGEEAAWVLDARGLGAAAMAEALDGVRADAWNASFDAQVLDRDVFVPAGRGRGRGVRWWDAQLADALLHAGLRGWYHGLAWASEHYLGVVAEGKGTVQLSFDAETDLSAEQVAYAAADAVETLWVGDVLRRRLQQEGLTAVADIEMAVRPLLDELQHGGMPFDRAGLARAVARGRASLGQVLVRLAEASGGGQGNLFTPDIEPTWNPTSSAEVRSALNRWARPAVEAVLERQEGRSRLLTADDRVDDVLLAEVGGPLADSLLDHRARLRRLAEAERLLLHVRPDDRLHPRHVQVVGSPNGVPAPRAPDWASFPPDLLAYARPEALDRLLVEVRIDHCGPGVPPGGPGTAVGLVGPVSNLVDAILAGAATAGTTATSGPRSGLSLPLEVDWALTLRLYDELGPLRAFRRRFRERHRRWPSRPETLAARPHVRPWVLDHEEALALGRPGGPLRWSVRSPAGRQRWFGLRTGELLRRAVMSAAATEDEELGCVWRAALGEDPLPLVEVGPAGADGSSLSASRRRALVAQLWRWSEERTAALLDDAVAGLLADLELVQQRAPVEMALNDATLAVAGALWERVTGPGAGPGGPVNAVALLGERLYLECDERRVADLVRELHVVARQALADVAGGLPLAVSVTVRGSLAP